MPYPSTSAADGIWQLRRVRNARMGGDWPLVPLPTFEYLIVAGGGGGATDVDVGGGGGAGGLLSGSTTLAYGQTYQIQVGGGGNRGTGPDSTGTGGGTNGTSGANSTAFGFTAIGGGFGGTRSNNGGAGGSGGGGGDIGGLGGAGTAGQGNSGGNSPAVNSNSGWDQGGGGGAGGAAVSFTPGLGLASSITGTSVTYAAGGQGSGYTFVVAPGAANTGNGGTGCRAGGSGIVVIRYLGNQVATGGTITSSGGYTIHTFTTLGDFVVQAS